MQKIIKDHISKLKSSATLAINEECRLIQKKGKKVFKFGFGQSPFPIPQAVVDELKKNAKKNQYLPMQGLEELRKTVALYLHKNFNYKFKSTNILIGPGTKELMLLLQICFDGEIILPAPSWVSYAPQAVVGKNKVHWIQTSSKNNWFPTAEEIENKLKSIPNKNILLYINSPNNPSGAVCKNYEEISKVVKKYNLIVLSDEIYSELTFQKRQKSISNFCPNHTIVSTGLSKWCGAGGWRLGFFAIPEKLNVLKNSLKILASESFSSVSAPIQYAAINAYSGNHSDYKKKVTNILSNIGNYVYNNLRSNKLNISKPEGGFYVMVELLNSNFSSSPDMCKDLLKKTGVALLPGSDFGFDKKKLIARLSYTDFNGKIFLSNTTGSKKLDDGIIKKYAPNVVEGIKRIKHWSNSF